MDGCGCPLAELYAKAAKERDEVTAAALRIQAERDSMKAELEELREKLEDSTESSREWKAMYHELEEKLRRMTEPEGGPDDFEE